VAAVSVALGVELPVGVLVLVGTLVGKEVAVAEGGRVVGGGGVAGVPLAAGGVVATGAAALGAQAGTSVDPSKANPIQITERTRRIDGTLGLLTTPSATSYRPGYLCLRGSRLGRRSERHIHNARVAEEVPFGSGSGGAE
jgi:hypothetical protein